MRVSDIGNVLSTVVRALANRLTAEDNFGPEGEKNQVLTSNGPRADDPPPSYKNLAEVIGSIVDSDPGSLVGIQGPPGLQGIPGVDGEMFGDLDGGEPDSVYGGMFVVDGGGV